MPARNARRRLRVLLVPLVVLLLTGGTGAVPAARPAPAAAASPSASCLPGHGLMSVNTPDELMAGRVRLAGGQVVSVGTTGDTTWGRPELTSSASRLLLSMSWANVLTRAYQQTGKRAYLDRVLALAKDFARDNPAGGGPDPLDAWTPMYAGQRAAMFACLHAAAPQDAAITAALQAHGAWLAASANDGGNWNQGIDAALGLLQAGCRLGQRAWQDTAGARFARMIRASIDGQGAFNEQAPGYASFVYSRWGMVADQLTRCGRPVPVEISQRRPLLLEFLAWATAPDGRLVQIGDTSAEPPVAPAGSPSQYAATLGAQGTPPKGAWKVYDAGYVFGRSTWSPYTAGTHYSLRFGPGRAWHGHHDHQSLTLSVPRGPVLVDAGHSGYDNEVNRLWERSPEAHNVLTLPGVRFDGAAATSLTRSASGAGWQWWEVRDTAYAGHGRTRGVYVDTALGFALVQDRATRPTDGLFRQVWHLPAGTRVDVSSRSVAAATSANGALRTTVVQLPLPGQQLPRGATTVVTGQRNPMQGWVSRVPGEQVAAPAVLTSHWGRTARMLTLVVATKPGVRVAASATASSTGYRAAVTVGGTTRVIGISAGGGMWPVT